MTVRNFKLVIEYDGAEFHGWQRQPRMRTVQETLETAVHSVTGEETQVNGAGRTDTGVHAVGQVGNFLSATKLPPKRLHAALNSRLPRDVRIRSIEPVPASFHARYSAIERRYVYYIRTEPTALYRRLIHVPGFPLDLFRMRAAARCFLGTHDFSGFAAAMPDERSTVCRVKRAEIKQSGVLISFHIDADRFLGKMVRIMVGTLLEAGRGKIGAEQIEASLCTKDRTAAGPALPPQGLFLVEVVYR